VSGRSTEARNLQLRLGAETGIRVEVCWNSSGGSRGWRWHVMWSDGPTETAMRALVDRVGREYRQLDVDALTYVRIVQPLSVALAMVRNVRLGLPPLGDAQQSWEFEDSLTETEYPERGSADDAALAGVLAQLGGYHSTDQMVTALNRYGLAGLRAVTTPPDNVVPLHRPRA
jgi:hypothetical protein